MSARACAAPPRRPEASSYEPGPPLTVIGDMDEVRAAVSNLIDNAVKYSGREP